MTIYYTLLCLIASLLFDASDIRPSGDATIQRKCGWITNPASYNCTAHFR